MAANLLIGLREGLEATLVVSILVAYLVKTGARHRLPAVAAGVAVAVALSMAVGAALTFGPRTLTFRAQEAIGGILSIVAVGLVTWMVFWMRRAARHLAADLRESLGAAASAGAVAVTAFLAVGREGLETAFLLWAAARATQQTWQPVVGAVLGIALAVGMGWLLYRQALRLDLTRFFRWTGVGLVVLAAGILAYGVHDLQEAGILPGLTALAFDVSATVPPSSWYATLVRGVLNITPVMTWLEVAAYLAYLVPVLALYLRRPAPARRTAAEGDRRPAPALAPAHPAS